MAASHGFSNARIRVDADLSNATYAAHLDRVINDTLAAGLIPILAKKATDLKQDPHNAALLNAYVAWWDDAAERYANATHRLVFDLMVEPAQALGDDIDRLNHAYALATDAIRRTNPTRLLSFAPGHIASPDYLDDLIIPSAARPYAMAEWHTFAAGPNPSGSSKKAWTGNGTAEQRQACVDLVDEAFKWQGSSNGAPTWFGAWMSNDFNKGSHYTVPEQVAFARFICQTVANRNIPWSINTYSIYFGPDDTPVPSLAPVLQVLENDC